MPMKVPGDSTSLCIKVRTKHMGHHGERSRRDVPRPYFFFLFVVVIDRTYVSREDTRIGGSCRTIYMKRIPWFVLNNSPTEPAGPHCCVTFPSELPIAQIGLKRSRLFAPVRCWNFGWSLSSHGQLRCVVGSRLILHLL
jgi:hypothetical protein